MARGKGARQGKVAPKIEKQVERISEKIKVPIVEYDVTKKDTTEFIRNTKPTTEFIRQAKDTIEYIRKTEPTTQYIKTVEPTIKYEEKVVPTTRYEENVVPTTRYEEHVEPTTRYEEKVEKTTKYDVEHDKLKLEEVVQKALDDLMKKNRLVIPRPKFEDERIKVFELVLKCPHCEKEFSLGGRKK